MEPRANPSVAELIWRRIVTGPAARWRAGWCSFMGRPDVGEPLLRSAATADPGSFAAQIAWGRALAATGRDAEARDAFRRACRLSPDRFLRQALPAALREVIAVEVALPVRGRRFACPVPAEVAPAPSDSSTARSDFSSVEEARRFLALPPLDKTAGQAVDWNRVAERLAREAESDDGDA